MSLPCNDSASRGISWGVGDAVRSRVNLLESSGADGCEHSLAAVYSADYERLVRLAYLLTGSRVIAEDLVQDSFLRLHDRWDDVRAPSAYLRTVVVNACRGHHRRTRREKAAFADLVRDGVQPETPPAARRAGPAALPPAGGAGAALLRGPPRS
jgi:DNA-directed RNA polymerase specialized sigma24 family protein